MAYPAIGSVEEREKTINMKKLKKINYAACWPYLAVVLFAAYLAYRQMRTGNIIIGSDTIFHFNRFYETEEQIRNGNLSWFMTLYGFNQSGRVINALYGPAFAYLNGLLLLAVGTWYRYQIITSFLVFAVGGVGMYRAVHRFNVRGSIAVLVTIIYMTIGWLPRWQSGSNFSGIGAALMPYGILVACDMFYDKEKPIHWIKLTILMTVALEVHLLTALMYMAFLVPAWLYAIIKREDKRGILLNTLKAVLLTIFLTVNTLLPLYWMSKTNTLAPTATMRMLENAVHLKHTTVAFHPFRILTHNLRASLTYWLAYAFIVQVIYAIWTREESKANVVVSLYGGFWLLLASRLVEWDRITNHLPALARFIQFPSRFVCIAYPLLIVGLGLSFEHILRRKQKWVKAAAYALLGLLTFAAADCLVITLTSNAWAGYQNNVGRSRNTKFGEETQKTSPREKKKKKKKAMEDYGAYHPVKLDDQRKQALVNTNAATHAHDLQVFLDMTEKAIPDYLPVYKWDPEPDVPSHLYTYKWKQYYTMENSKITAAYRKSVMNHNRNVKVKAVKHGLKLTWKAKKGKHKQQLPVITYKQSKLTVNGRVLTKYKRNRVGAPTVPEKTKGTNTAYLEFQTPLWIKLAIAVSLLGQFAAVVWGLLWRGGFFKKREEKKA